MADQRQTIRERYRNAYPISLARTWGEASWTATDLAHRFWQLKVAREIAGGRKATRTGSPGMATSCVSEKKQRWKGAA